MLPAARIVWLTWQLAEMVAGLLVNYRSIKSRVVGKTIAGVGATGAGKVPPLTMKSPTSTPLAVCHTTQHDRPMSHL